MQPQIKDILREIGAQLDQNQLPRVYNGGIVLPNETTVSNPHSGKEKCNAKPRQRRPATGPWQGATGRQRQTCRPWSSAKASQIICSGFQEQYEAELDAVLEAYPSTKFRHQKRGLWLLTDSTLILGLGKKATFLTYIPYDFSTPAKSWGFWTSPIYSKWIGPRHTNYPDGSICAFEPRDQTWFIGDGIVELIDLYSLWAIRHLHLELIGRWPGYQSVPHAHERVAELKDDEFCGCDSPHKLYKNCCKQDDIESENAALARGQLNKLPNGGFRAPPKTISKFINGAINKPANMNLLLSNGADLSS